MEEEEDHLDELLELNRLRGLGDGEVVEGGGDDDGGDDGNDGTRKLEGRWRCGVVGYEVWPELLWLWLVD